VGCADWIVGLRPYLKVWGKWLKKTDEGVVEESPRGKVKCNESVTIVPERKRKLDEMQSEEE